MPFSFRAIWSPQRCMVIHYICPLILQKLSSHQTVRLNHSTAIKWKRRQDTRKIGPCVCPSLQDELIIARISTSHINWYLRTPMDFPCTQPALFYVVTHFLLPYVHVHLQVGTPAWWYPAWSFYGPCMRRCCAQLSMLWAMSREARGR